MICHCRVQVAQVGSFFQFAVCHRRSVEKFRIYISCFLPQVLQEPNVFRVGAKLWAVVRSSMKKILFSRMNVILFHVYSTLRLIAFYRFGASNPSSSFIFFS